MTKHVSDSQAESGLWDAIRTIGEDFWMTLAEMSPYLLFGFLVAGILHVVLSTRMVRRHLGGEGVLASFKAALFGVPLPLCSCGVIPVSASLRRSGAGKGPTTSFLISTPQTGVDSIMVTYALLGGVYALFRPIVAFFSGWLGGILVSLLPESHAHSHDIPDDSSVPSGEACQPKDILAESPGACCEEPPEPDPGDQGLRGKVAAIVHHGFVELPQDIGKALLVGLGIAAMISALLPADSLPGVLGGGIVAMLIMMVAGIPVYVCATASVPIAAALIAKGVSPGAALVFLMTGPATNAATLAMIWRVMGKAVAGVYLLTVGGSALLSGILLDALFEFGGFQTGRDEMSMLPMEIKTVSAIGLLAILGWAILRSYVRRPVRSVDQANREEHMVFSVVGMTCSHCRQAVQEALEAVRGVDIVEVDLHHGRAVVAGQDLDSEQLGDAIRRAGYQASLLTGTPS